MSISGVDTVTPLNTPLPSSPRAFLKIPVTENNPSTGTDAAYRYTRANMETFG